MCMCSYRPHCAGEKKRQLVYKSFDLRDLFTAEEFPNSSERATSTHTLTHSRSRMEERRQGQGPSRGTTWRCWDSQGR